MCSVYLVLLDRFKDTIGEMKYFLKANEFTATMQSLAGMVQMEMNADFLDVSIRNFIPKGSN